MKKFCLLGLLTLSILIIGCANPSSPAVCSLEIENTLSEELLVHVGQVKILSNNNGKYYTWDWDSLGTWNEPSENRYKFLPFSKVQSKEIVEIFGYPDEGYGFFIFAQVTPNGPGNGYGIPKYAKKVYIYLNQNNQMVISMYPKV